MKKEKKILIVSIINQLEARDPNWAGNGTPMEKLKILYEGWTETERRHGRHYRQYYETCWKRGWLKEEDFSRFHEYAMQ